MISIGNRRVGEGEPCFVIAEAGVNHNGSIDMALQLVDAAAVAGADAVKFQKRHLPSLYPEGLLRDPNKAEWAFNYLIPILQETELSDSDFRRIKSHCDERGILFLCSPWDHESLSLLQDIGLDAYKIGSADLVNLPLIDSIAATGKPLILSTGMATPHEIEATVNHLKMKTIPFAILHCITAYPAPFEALNLRYITCLKEFGVPVGYSGHERGISAPIIAVTLGASIIEKHLTLDRTLPGPDHAASLEPYGFKKLVRDIRVAEVSLGRPEKRLCNIELINRHVLRKSLIATRSINAGEIVNREMIAVRGPGKGITPQRIDDLIGVRLERSVDEGDYFVEGDLRGHVNRTIDRRFLRRPWGLKTRFHDLSQILRLDPPLVEFHFTAEDLDHEFVIPTAPYSQQLFVHAPEFFERRLFDLTAENDEHRERSIELLQRTIDKVCSLVPYFSGPAAVVIHVGGMSMDAPTQETRLLLERAIQSFRKVDSKGLLLLPENLPPRPWYFGGQWYQNVFTKSEDMVEFCQELGVGMTLDLSHAQLHCTLAEDDLSEYVKRCLPFVRHLHIADASGIDGEGLQIGEGVIDWPQILRILEDTEFSWVPEIWSGHLQNGTGFIEALHRIVQLGGL